MGRRTGRPYSRGGSGDVEALCSELEIIDAPIGAILAADHVAMVATVIGFRANATAIAVPSLSPWRSVGGKQQRQERVAADLGGPDPVVADSFGRRHLIGDAGQIGAAGIVDLAADVAIHRIVRLISVNAAEIHHDDARDDYINSDYRHGVDRLAEEGDADTDDRCCADAGPEGAARSRVARADRPRK
jgi:hypothetical protein